MIELTHRHGVPGRGRNRPGRGHHRTDGDRIDDSTLPTKICTKCGRALPREMFHRRAATPSGIQPRCKDCRCAESAAYRAAYVEERRAYDVAHAEENRARSAAWGAAHVEERRARDAAHRAAHLEEHRAREAAYRITHAEERRAYNAAHAEEIRVWKAAYRAAHHEERRASWRNRYAQKCAAGGTHTAADVRAQLKRQRGRCFYCRDKVGKTYHVDHVTPLIKSGHNGPENLVITCPRCNLSKGAKHPMDFAGILF